MQNAIVERTANVFSWKLSTEKLGVSITKRNAYVIPDMRTKAVHAWNASVEKTASASLRTERKTVIAKMVSQKKAAYVQNATVVREDIVNSMTGEKNALATTAFFSMEMSAQNVIVDQMESARSKKERRNVCVTKVTQKLTECVNLVTAVQKVPALLRERKKSVFVRLVM